MIRCICSRARLGALVGLALVTAAAAAPIEILYDAADVPHVYADSEAELAYALGVLHARARLFQMDAQRKAALGRSAELLGPQLLPLDALIRKLGLGRVAARVWRRTPGAEVEVLRAYADGVNAHLAELRSGAAPLPPDYAALALDADDVDPWRPEDSLAIGLGLMFTLNESLSTELYILEFLLLQPEDVVHDLYRFAPPDPTVIVPGRGRAAADREPRVDLAAQRAWVRALDPRVVDGLRSLVRTLDPERSRAAGPPRASNSWVVAPERTRDGFALLANDPHLTLTSPPTWYLAHLDGAHRGGELHAQGLTLPGFPGVFLGHNQRIAWGATTLSADTMDVYVELMNDGRVLFEGRWVPVVELPETFHANVDGERVDRTETIRDPVTRLVPHHGPLLWVGPFGALGLSVRWTALETETTHVGFLRLQRALDLDAYTRAVRLIEAGAFHLTYADVEGHIHYSGHIRVPRRERVRLVPPYLPRPGGGSFEWTEDVAEELLPQALDPERGFLVTANNDPLGFTLDNDPLNDAYYLAPRHAVGFRAGRIDAWLAARDALTVDDVMALQADVADPLAERFLPHLEVAAERRPDLLTPAGRRALDRLRGWDRRASASGVAETLSHTWLYRLWSTTLADDLGLVPPSTSYLSSGMLFVLDHPEQAALGDRLFDLPATPEIEGRDEALLGALELAAADVEARCADEDCRWGALHTVTMAHPLGAPFSLPSAGPLGTDGSDYTVDVASCGITDTDFAYEHGASARLVTELRPGAVRTWAVLPGGQSGTLGDPHREDQLDLWRRNAYLELAFARADVEAAAVRRELLDPPARGAGGGGARGAPEWRSP